MLLSFVDCPSIQIKGCIFEPECSLSYNNSNIAISAILLIITLMIVIIKLLITKHEKIERLD